MGFIEIIFIGFGLAMDAFAVAVCKGLSMKKLDWKKGISIALYFGIFQGGMPLIGYLLGTSFEIFITRIDHWVTFILLGIIGGNMIKESTPANELIDFKTMVPLAIATSIDALAIGITFAFLNVNIVSALLIIAIITFILSLIGVQIGNKVGSKYEKKAELLGGFILVFIGLKILLEHLGL